MTFPFARGRGTDISLPLTYGELMATLALTYSDLYDRVAKFLGTYGSAGPAGDNLTDAKAIVNDAYTKFITARKWTFLKPSDTLGLMTNQYVYEMPELFSSLRIEPPTDLRDAVWIPANFTWVNEGEVPGLIPTRYPGSECSEDEAVRLARKTEWVEKPGEVYLGLGQRMFATDKGEFSLLQVRQIELNHNEVEQQGGMDNG